MGEYATTLTGEHVKIGTCESLYYLRPDQLDQLEPGSRKAVLDHANVYRFRFPFPDPRVMRECRVWDTSLDFKSAEELMDLWEWCQRALDAPGYAYTMLKETLLSLQHSIEEGLPDIPDAPASSEPIMFGDYAVTVTGDGVEIRRGTEKVHGTKTMKQALAWVSAKIAEAAA